MLEQKIVVLFKNIPELDAEIRRIEFPFKNIDYFVVEVGLYESLGEQGEILTLIFDVEPSEEDICFEIRQKLEETKEYLTNSILSHQDEQYLKILNKIDLN